MPLRSIPKIGLSILSGLFFSTTISLFNQSFLRSKHSLIINIELWVGLVLLFTAASFLIAPFVYRKIKNHGKISVMLLWIFCVGLSFIALKAFSYSYLKSNNLIVFISIPMSGIDENKEIQIAEVKTGNHVFDLNDFQFEKGCKQTKILSITCESLSVIEYINETNDDSILPVQVLLFDQTGNDYKMFSFNNNLISINNVYFDIHILFWVLLVNHSLVKLMVGFSLSIFALCLLLFTDLIQYIHIKLDSLLSKNINDFSHIILDYFRVNKRDLIVLVPFIIIVLIYVWLSTGGTMYKLYNTTYYYNYLTDAFLHGQTHLLIEPAKELLALPDPYDPQANVKWRLHDASLFNGKYYLYWGPVPALVLILIKYFSSGVMIRDQLLVIGFAIGIFFFMMKLILIIARELFTNIPKWVIFIAIITLGLAISQTWLLGRPFIYEAAISGGQFFLLGGVFFAYYAFEKEHQKKMFLLLAAICWALAVGSRATQVVAVVCLFLLTTWRIMHTPDKKYILDWKSLLALSLPLVTGMFLLAWYNYVRFGTVMEFGMTYALSGARNDSAFKLDHIIPNLYFYFVRFSSIKLLPQFPFIDTTSARPELFPLPDTYFSYVHIIGLLWVFPFIWVIPISIIYGLYFRRSITIFIRGKIDKSKVIWFGLCLLSTSAALIPQLMFLGAPMRYFADFLPGLGLMAFLIFCFIYSNLNGHTKAQNSLLIIFLFLALFTFVLGFLLGINSEEKFTLFSDTNPALFNWLVEHIHY